MRDSKSSLLRRATAYKKPVAQSRMSLWPAGLLRDIDSVLRLIAEGKTELNPTTLARWVCAEVERLKVAPALAVKTLVAEFGRRVRELRSGQTA